MTVVRRVFVSLPADEWLTKAQNNFKWAIVEEIEKVGLFPELFHDPHPRRGLANADSWSPAKVDAVTRRCIGAVIIGLPRWIHGNDKQIYRHASEYCHYEGSLTRTIRLPLLLLAEQGLVRRGIFDQNIGFITEFPLIADRKWLKSRKFKNSFEKWITDIETRRDIFLGYCGSSTSTAKLIKDFLGDELKVKTLDWSYDFVPAGSILSQIEEAAERCTAGIFLFTKDDKIGGKAVQAAPRDNVVFEAGYFAAAKGKERVLIIREAGSKMPADLGGDIYAKIENKTNIDTAKDDIIKFVRSRL